MDRRRFLLASAALALVPVPALAGRVPKLELLLSATVEHRRKRVHRKKVKLRFTLYTSQLDRNPSWEEIQTVNIQDGKLETTLGKGLGTVDENLFAENAYLGIFVLEMGPEVQDVKLSPRLKIDWHGDGSAPCLEQNESLAQGDMELGGSCNMAGEGALVFYVTRLQRVPTDAEWAAEVEAKGK
jgi:hypothetical protein